MTALETRAITTVRPPRRRNLSALLGFTPLVLFLLIWQVIGDPHSPYFPPPSTWWQGFLDLFESGAFVRSTLSTVWSFAVALVLATAIGAFVGAVIGSSRAVERATSPSIQFLMSIPPAAIVPVATLVVGIGFGVQVGVIIFGSVWPILLNSAAAMRSVPAVRLESARMLGLSAQARFFKVVLPSLAPGVLLGVTVAAPIAIVVTLLVEMLTTVPGLGALLLQAQRSFNSPEVFALLVIVGLLGYVLNALIAAIRKALLRNMGPKGAAGDE